MTAHPWFKGARAALLLSFLAAALAGCGGSSEDSGSLGGGSNEEALFGGDLRLSLVDGDLVVDNRLGSPGALAQKDASGRTLKVDFVRDRGDGVDSQRFDLSSDAARLEYYSGGRFGSLVQSLSLSLNLFGGPAASCVVAPILDGQLFGLDQILDNQDRIAGEAGQCFLANSFTPTSLAQMFEDLVGFVEDLNQTSYEGRVLLLPASRDPLVTEVQTETAPQSE